MFAFSRLMWTHFTVCFGFRSDGVNTPSQLDLLQFVSAVDQREHTFTVGSLCLFWLTLGVNTPLQFDLLQLDLLVCFGFARCEHAFTVGSLSLFWLSLGWCEHTFTVGSLSLFWPSLGVNTPLQFDLLQLDLLQFVLAFTRCEHTFTIWSLTVGSLTVCFGFHSVWIHLYSWISHSLFWLSLSVNTPLQLDLLQFVLAYPRCEHTFTVWSLTVCFGFHSVWTHLYSWISHSLFWLSLGVNTPLQFDLLQFALAFTRCEHTFTVWSLTVCFGFHSVWTHLYSLISHSLFWLISRLNSLVKQPYWKHCLLTPDPLT